MVKNWDKRTPDNFRFTAKLPKLITHKKKFKNVEKDLELFYKRMEPLEHKILSLLIQLPPSYKLKEGPEDFSRHDFFFEGDFRYAFEVRHSSWFSERIIFLKITILQWSGVKWIDYKLLQW